MEGLQTTETSETLVFTENDDNAGSVKDSKKRERKELFQINTHPAAVVAANNKRDRRLKKIVMRVVAFCKKEHEEGQQIPFRFFKKRASVMTGVSLSTIHRIETIDVKLPDFDQLPSSDSSPGKARTKDGAAVKKVKKKKKKKKEKKENAEVVVRNTHHSGINPSVTCDVHQVNATAGVPAAVSCSVHHANAVGSVPSLVTSEIHQSNVDANMPARVSSGIHHTNIVGHVPAGVTCGIHNTDVAANVAAAITGTSGGPLIQYSDLVNLTNQIQFHAVPAVTVPYQPTVPPTSTPVSKPEKKRKKRTKAEPPVNTPLGSSNMVATVVGNQDHINVVSPVVTKTITNMQPAAIHSLAGGVGGGALTTINVQNGIITLPTALASPTPTTTAAPTSTIADRTAPCAWTAGPIVPFTVGDLRDGGCQQLQLATSQVQLGGQTMQVGTAIPVNAQLQPISVQTGAGPQRAFTGQIDTSGWSAGTLGHLGTLQGTATLVGQQVVQAYHSNNNTVHATTSHQQQQQQQPQQHQSIFYQF